MISAFSCGLSTLILMFSAVPPSLAGGGVFSIPPLQQLLPLALKNKQNPSLSVSEINYQVRDSYYQIQFKSNQLGVAEEVKKRFTTAVEKAQERFDAAEEDISQSDITKLKLGLSGSLNDILELNNEIHISKLNLARLTGLGITAKSQLEEDTILPVTFPKISFEEYFGEKYRSPLLDQKKILLQVDQARDKLTIARDSRKITRALLVTEVANYDFGIGNSGDLFQALIIYTRVLSGYYETVYHFNIGVAGLKREKEKRKIPDSATGGTVSPQ